MAERPGGEVPLSCRESLRIGGDRGDRFLEGKSTTCLGHGALAGHRTPVYAVDPHTGSSEHRDRYGKVDTLGEFRANIARTAVESIVVPVVKPSQQAAAEFDGGVGLLFVDGDHSYEGVKTDLDSWIGKVVEGGVIAFHDTDRPGVRRLLEEDFLHSERFADIGFVGGVVYGRKRFETRVRSTTRDRAICLLWRMHVWLLPKRMPRGIRFLGRDLMQSIQRRPG